MAELNKEHEREALKDLKGKVTEYFMRLRKAGKLDQTQLESWLRQLHWKLSKPVKAKSDEIIYEQNQGAGEKLQDEIVECITDLRKAGTLEQRQVEWWLSELKKSLFFQSSFDLGEGDQEIGECLG